MTKLYADENFRQKIVDGLLKKGLDIKTSHEANNHGLSDPDQLEYATEQNRIILTDNRKDFIALHRSKIEHAGIYSYKPDTLSVEEATRRTQYVSSTITDMHNTHVRINKEEIMIERSGEERETLQYSPEFRKQEYLDHAELERESSSELSTGKDIGRE